MDYSALKLVFKNYDQRKAYFVEHYTELLGKSVVETLIGEGFLTAPASTKYHGAYVGGLFDHSVIVANVLSELSLKNSLVWENGKVCTSPLRIGILHDLCKIDQYNEVVEAADKDKICSHYEWNNDPIIKGHGMKSALYAQALGISLTSEELACIVYHMGAFTDSKEWRDYTNAVNRCPNVLWTHHADMIASHIMEV